MEFEKSERVDHTCREVTLSQCNSSPRRPNAVVKDVLQMFLFRPSGIAVHPVLLIDRHEAALFGHVAPGLDKKSEM